MPSVHAHLAHTKEKTWCGKSPIACAGVTDRLERVTCKRCKASRARVDAAIAKAAHLEGEAGR